MQGGQNRTLIIAIVIVLLLCCCCLFLVSGYFVWGDPLVEFLEIA
jgi:hypothetical protein